MCLGPLWDDSDAPRLWFEVAQLIKGPNNELDELGDTTEEQLRAFVDIKRFEIRNTTLKVDDGSGKVTIRYTFPDFRGNTPESTQWEGIVETQCQRHVVEDSGLTQPTSLIGVMAMSPSCLYTQRIWLKFH